MTRRRTVAVVLLLLVASHRWWRAGGGGSWIAWIALIVHQEVWRRRRGRSWA